MPIRWISRVLAAACVALSPISPSQAAPPSAYEQAIPDAVRGPFVSDRDVVTRLDCPSADCRGPFSFSRLMEARMPPSEQSHGGNPFNSTIGRPIRDVITDELAKVRKNGHAPGQQLHEQFLTDEHSRIELVGIVNRMDRQFVKDPSVGLSKEQQGCGEISLIYRFAYSIRNGKQDSRLPVTLNLVFPALPFDTHNGQLKCRDVAKRWLDEVARPAGRTAAQQVADLTDPANGPLSTIEGRDILRVELNLQEYRIKASNDDTGFGSEAAYLLRVFRWDPKLKKFQPSFLRNQIDRAKVLADDKAKKALIAFLLRDDTIASVDTGTLEIPFELPGKIRLLAERAVSISPGGIHRSGNQPFWNAKSATEQILSDPDIDKALRRLADKKVPLSFVKSVEDFRLRLNQQSCTGCHQTRAIAGFHFPGADREKTPLPNSVLLPGSPQFYGDQPRRMQILEAMASRPDSKLTEYELASSYSDRPLNKFADKLKDTDLIGGWGGACIADEALPKSQRQWNCRSGLRCEPLFADVDHLGTCVPPPTPKMQIGDPLQRGNVESKSYGWDSYLRLSPPIVGGDTRIKVLPPNPPTGNSYYGAHQEYYEGNPDSTDRDVRRDAQTGGFPAGMLRLSECVNLPAEASCGLVASSGFNDCIKAIADDETLSVNQCFDTFTSFAGIRACDAARPCRDDYICVNPMGYDQANAAKKYDDRKKLLETSDLFKRINGAAYKASDYYGQTRPDPDWLARKDARGLCIPPYFVFQFRADGHPAP